MRTEMAMATAAGLPGAPLRGRRVLSDESVHRQEQRRAASVARAARAGLSQPAAAQALRVERERERERASAEGRTRGRTRGRRGQARLRERGLQVPRAARPPHGQTAQHRALLASAYAHTRTHAHCTRSTRFSEHSSAFTTRAYPLFSYVSTTVVYCLEAYEMR